MDKHFYLKILFITCGVIFAIQIPFAIYSLLYMPPTDSLQRKD